MKAIPGPGQQPFKLLLELMQNELAWVKVSGPERLCWADAGIAQ